jgi:hypothetical protein
VKKKKKEKERKREEKEKRKRGGKGKGRREKREEKRGRGEEKKERKEERFIHPRRTVLVLCVDRVFRWTDGHDDLPAVYPQTGNSDCGHLAAGYFGLALHLFSAWTPVVAIVAPLFVSAPAGIAYATARKYADARQQRDKVRAAFRHFVPPEVADELERNAGRIVSTRKSIECTCVATDAAKFSTFAESMESEALTDFLNQYFDSLFKPVIEHEGFVSDVVGDAMLAIWPDNSAQTRRAYALPFGDAGRHR